MRRFLAYIAVLGFVGTFMTGCRCGGWGQGHPHGICDCYQITPCCTRQPWVTPTPPAAPATGPQIDSKKL